MEFLRIHSKEDLQKNLVPGVWGIREPAVEHNGTPRETGLSSCFIVLHTHLTLPLTATSPTSPPIDLILMPGMAFDKTFSRLGHGKGYYDRFIAAYRASIEEAQKRHEVLLCTLKLALLWAVLISYSGALSLEEQILEDGVIPMTETDVRLNMIVTAQGASS
jgi:5-formyltetrahydrofolate cyclo-ligase